MILAIGPRLEGHSVIFLATQTRPSCRFLLAVDSLGLRRSGSSSQFIDPPQDFPKQVPGHGDFAPLMASLGEHGHGLGSRYTTDALIEHATGKPLDPKVFEAHLKARYLGEG